MLKIEERSSNLSLDNFENCDDENFSEIEDETTTTTTEYTSPGVPLPWDAFTYFPSKKESASMRSKKWLQISMRVIKVLVYGVLFCTVLCSGIITKFVFLLAVSQLEEKKITPFCDYFSEYDEALAVKITNEGRVVWIWYIIFMFLVPEGLTIFHSIWNFLFKKRPKLPKKTSLAVLFLLEMLHTIGLALLIFYSFPRINSADAAAISNCVCFIPALLTLLSQYKKQTNTTGMFLLILMANILALTAQGSGVFLQSFLNYNVQDPVTWILPIALVFSSCRWWSNYIYSPNYTGHLKFISNIKIDLNNKNHIVQGFVSIWRCCIFILSAVIIFVCKGIRVKQLFEFSWKSEYDILYAKDLKSFSVRNILFSDMRLEYDDIADTIIDTSTPSNIFLVQAFFTFILYEAAIFAYQTQMHRVGFALPITLVTPATICLILILDTLRQQDSCAIHEVMPDHLFLNAYDYKNVTTYLLSWRVWCWIVWWLSQIWITFQIWLGENERLATIEKIFYHACYDPFLADQFLTLNKRRHENDRIVKEELEDEDEDQPDPTTEYEIYGFKNVQWNNSHPSSLKEHATNKRSLDNIQIYACATMWHETKEEMSLLIGSILRLDRDQCAMKVTQKYYKIRINDYYELETHVMFDDAFCCMHGCIESCDHNENEIQVNQYVVRFVEAMEENIKNLGILALPPIKCPAPYGGQLIWNLPGKTRLTVHLKDKNKIRHRKRWSQVMYMYYLLGHLLMGTSMDVETKEMLAKNTYILTLDGDVDFRPTAVKTLIDLMKKNGELGAVCGRIHPTGKGPMIWFQKFEYAVGHWLQKSTEHTIGSVLCSPGCFSLFRAKALMQTNVIAKYATKSTEPEHYIQYDQGEDRWLCTLILQAGCKVEYCAAGDAYTHAPESFKEFYIQRRRWIPSTIANILDLLSTSKKTRELNDDISWLYIAYQWILTGSTIIGPAFIYLMMVGAFVTSFQLDNWLSFWYNSIPLIIFVVVCFFCKLRIQLIVAEVLSVLYALVMLVVLVGIVLQIAADGFFAPNAILFFIVIGQFVMAAFLHPQELSCLPNAFIYYITVPSMYMLLIIFSIFNLHNITWGTRESKIQRQAFENKSPIEQYKEHANKNSKYSLANLLSCNFFTCRRSEPEEHYLESIYKSINEINIRLTEIESKCANNKISKEDVEEMCNSESQMYNEEVKLQVTDEFELCGDSNIELSEHASHNSYKEYSNYLVNPHWLQDQCLQNGKVDFLPISEEVFWKSLIEKYLHPIENDVEKQKDVAKGLMNIRNQYLLKFFMINTLFVVAIFLLQMNKNVLHLQWPFAITYNITYVEEYEVHITRNYMHLEPIGCLFIIGFIFILVIQFLAMLIHRFTTFAHILTNVTLSVPSFKKDELSPEDLVSSEHAENIAQCLQHAVEEDTLFKLHKSVVSSSGKRKTVKELMDDVQDPPKRPLNFEVLFHKKLRNPTTSGFSKSMSTTVPKGTMEAFERRRSNILASHNRRQTVNNVENHLDHKKHSKQHVYDNPTFLNDNQH